MYRKKNFVHKGDYFGWNVINANGKMFLMLGLKSVELEKNTVSAYRLIANDKRNWIVSLEFVSGKTALVTLDWDTYRDLMIALN